MSHNNVEEQIGGAHHFPEVTKMVDCQYCISAKKCCGQFFADGTCCGGGDPITVKCPPHAIVEAVTWNLTRNMRESEAA